MAVGDETREVIAREVTENVSHHLTIFRQECQSKCGELFSRMASSERDRAELHTRAEAEREMLKLQLNSLGETLNRMAKQLDGNGSGPLLLRIAMLEEHQRVLLKVQEELKQKDERQTDRKDNWKRVLIQPLVPVVFSWLGAGMIYGLWVLLHLVKP